MGNPDRTLRQMRARPYSGSVRFMKADSEWLGAQDLAGVGRVRIRIAEVLQIDAGVRFCGRQTEKAMWVLKHEIPDGDGWKPAPKLWQLNVTNRKRLWRRFGNDTTAWVGQVVELGLEPTRNPGGGGPVYGVRVMPDQLERDEDAMMAHMRQLEQDPRSDEEVREDSERAETTGCPACGYTEGHQDGCPEAPGDET